MMRRSRPEVEVGFPMVRVGTDGTADESLFHERSLTMSQGDLMKEFRAGRVHAKVWKNEREVDGRTVPILSVRIQTSYRDKDSGDWKNGSSFSASDLACVHMLSALAFEYVTLHGQEQDGATAKA